jgi:hypothetical protein
MRALKAGVTYFLLVFAVGWIRQLGLAGPFWANRPRKVPRVSRPNGVVGSGRTGPASRL